MTECILNKANFNRKLFLLAAVWLAVALPAFGQRDTVQSEGGAVKVSSPVYAQLLHPDVVLPSFETATLKLSENLPVTYWGWGPYGYVFKTPMIVPSRTNYSASVRRAWPYELHALSVTAADLIGRAYGIYSNDQLVGAPEWAVSQGYDLDAKVDDVVAGTLEKKPSDRLIERLMLQSLLVRQMKLKVHFETRELPVYELVVAKGGPKLTVAKYADDPAKGFSLVRWPDWAVKGLTLDEFVEDKRFKFLPELDGHLVVNETGLTGAYDFNLRWAMERTAIGCNGDSNGLCFTAGPDANVPSLFTALEEQAGLRLVLTTAPIEVVVVDHIEMPGKPVAPASTQDMVGNWQGSLQGRGHPMRMVLSVVKSDDGYWIGKLYILYHHPETISLTGIAQGNVVKFSILEGLKFEGRLSSDGTSITGKWIGMADSFPLSLLRSTSETALEIPAASAPPGVSRTQHINFRLD